MADSSLYQEVQVCIVLSEYSVGREGSYRALSEVLIAQGSSLIGVRGEYNMEASSSSSQIEARLTLIQQDLDEVKDAHNRLEIKQTRMQKTGTTHWESMTQELKEIREEIFDDNLTNMKDIGNFTGGLGNRLAELEKKVDDLFKDHVKTDR